MVSGILVEDIIPKKGGQCSFYLKLPKIKVFKEKIGSKFDTTVIYLGAWLWFTWLVFFRTFSEAELQMQGN